MQDKNNLLKPLSLQQNLIRFFAPISVIFFAVYAFLLFQQGDSTLGTIYSLAGIVVVCSGFLAQKQKYTALASNIFGGIGPIVLLPWQVSGGVEGSGLAWFITYEIFVILFLGFTAGSYWLGVTYVLSLCLFWLQLSGVIAGVFTTGQLIQFYFVSLMSYALIGLFMYTHKQLERLMTEQNAVLDNTKKAMVDVMDDLAQEKDKLLEAKAKDEAILHSIGYGLVVTDENGKITLVNQSFQKLLGWTEKQVLGKSFVDIVPLLNADGHPVPKDQRLHYRAVHEGKNMDTSINDNLLYQRSDKSRFPVYISISPIILNQKIIGTVEVFRDITEEKAIDKAKTEFVSLASHQLRTPLSSINWYTEMLLAGDAGKVNKEQRNYLDEIFAGNKRMTELVGALLNVSRVDLGTFTVEPEPTDVIKLAKETVRDLEPRIFARKQKFDEDYDESLPIMQVDPKLMRMIIENLASNAIKYTPEGGKITLELKKTPKHLKLTVTDSGYGIPKAQRSRVFGKLFRADNVKSHDTEGTGLGLYLIKSIIDYTGGKIWFDSVENQGTTFYVELPLQGMPKKSGSKSFD